MRETKIYLALHLKLSDMKKLILVIIAISSITASCVKYEEGPSISNRSVEKRIYGFHFLKEYNVNGVDCFNEYYDSLGLRFNFIHDEDANKDVCIMDGTRSDNKGTDLYWWWELSDNKKLINIRATGGTSLGIGPFGIYKVPIWEIIKLDKDKMKLKTTEINKEYIVVLERP